MKDREHVRKVIERLGEELYHLCAIQNTYSQLFESGQETSALLHSSDSHFFHELQIVYLNYISIAVSRLFDPATTGKKVNLTFYYLLRCLNETHPNDVDGLRAALDTLRAQSYNFTEPRNQLVAHLDLGINVDAVGRYVPTFLAKEFENTYKGLGEILNHVRKMLGMPESLFALGIAGHGFGRKLLHRLRTANESLER